MLLEHDLVAHFKTLGFENLSRCVADCGLNRFSSIVVCHGNLSNRELYDYVLILEASFDTHVVQDQVPVRVDLRVAHDLTLERVKDDLDRIHSELEPHTCEEFSFGLSTAILGSFSSEKSFQIFFLAVFSEVRFITLYRSAFLNLFNLFASELCCADGSNRSTRIDKSGGQITTCHTLSLEQILMDKLLFGGASEAYVPKDHLPPVAADCLALLLLRRTELTTLALAQLNECLQAHRGAVLLEILNVAECLCITHELHHVATEIRCRCENQL